MNTNYLSKKINYISADCGAGKTYSLTQMIQRTDDRYIIVQGTLQLVEQTKSTLGEICKVITSKDSDSVENDLHAFLMKPTHRVLIITDKAFTRITDLSLLRQWKIYLDDVVNFHSYNVINTEKKYEVEHQLFKDFDSLSKQYLTAKAITEFSDDLVQTMSTRFGFIQDYDHFVMNSNFFDKIGKSGNTDIYSTANNQLTILAWINIAKYIGQDITFMANKFEESLIYKSDPKLFEEINLDGMLKRKVPVQNRLKVYYFSEERFSRTYRNNNPDALSKVAEWINNNVCEYFYTTNSDNKNILNGKYIDPISRGMNSYQDYTKCVWLVSMKPSPVETKQLELMFKLTREEVVQARERENLYQFVQRSNLRDYDSAEIIEVYVFDKEQALSLSTDINYIDIGLSSNNNKFEPLNLCNTKKQRLKRAKKKFETIEKFSEWLSTDTNNDLSDREKEHFIKSYLRK
ncbi:hypothetical protein [Candidatus Symbiopectobacterium sp. NZEC135]|uniref:hypothetical protein n=1 Tax=Candidatus Symbiopectobacterium sp. NZEC135 TaxID=2820471 RepID=UPI002226D584|nr:hypothetical protein [Candidatus Symbiopectobacterium sp. NZEC135]MCW2478137.1 hypothetical protein [Candidatus Symbiopectobacterium sp. NZEC135]